MSLLRLPALDAAPQVDGKGTITAPRPHRRSRFPSLVAAVLVAGTGIVLACSDSTSPNRAGTFFGPVTAVAGGSARTYLILDAAGKPTDLGLAITEAALTGLPAAQAEYVLTFPSEASATPFKHAVINWNPNGHPPPMVYTVPHFDFHFYMITQAELEAITPADSQFATKMTLKPASDFIPARYASDPGGVPRMGLHWTDPAAPEFNGQAFTRTFVYGSYNGTFIFDEPMVTKAYLDGKPATLVTPVQLPARYAQTGYLPTSYTTGYDATTREYRIALSGLVLR
ncbi:MAG: DUF5602 domain-containing protein [Gemmatimonadota bacterium]|nr:DUF5602 domain-containing protein [Gemmatimonadota bacterium]